MRIGYMKAFDKPAPELLAGAKSALRAYLETVYPDDAHPDELPGGPNCGRVLALPPTIVPHVPGHVPGSGRNAFFNQIHEEELGDEAHLVRSTRYEMYPASAADRRLIMRRLRTQLSVLGERFLSEYTRPVVILQTEAREPGPNSSPRLLRSQPPSGTWINHRQRAHAALCKLVEALPSMADEVRMTASGRVAMPQKHEWQPILVPDDMSNRDRQRLLDPAVGFGGTSLLLGSLSSSQLFAGTGHGLTLPPTANGNPTAACTGLFRAFTLVPAGTTVVYTDIHVDTYAVRYASAVRYAA